MEVTSKHHDREGTKNSCCILRNRPDLVALVIDGIQHRQTYHADLINDHNGFSFPQRIHMWIDVLSRAIVDINGQRIVDSASTNIVSRRTSRSHQENFSLPLQKFISKLNSFNNPGFS